MSNTKERAADELIRFSQMLGGVIALAPELKAVGSLEAAADAARAQLADAQRQEAELRSVLSGLASEVEAAKAWAERIRSEVDAAAASTRAAAEAHLARQTEAAEAIVAKANDEGAAIVAAAEARASETERLAQAAADDLEASLTEKRGELAKVEAALAARKEALDALKASAAKLAGG